MHIPWHNTQGKKLRNKEKNMLEYTDETGPLGNVQVEMILRVKLNCNTPSDPN